MAKGNTKQPKFTEAENGALIFGIGLITGVGSTVAAFTQLWEYSFLAIIAALVILRMVSANK